MENKENIENLIIDENLIKIIEDTILKYYKTIFELTNLLISYQKQIKDIEKDKGDNLANQIYIYKGEIRDLKLKVNLAFEGLLKFSDENNYFFCYSTLRTYKFYFESFFWNFKTITGESDKLQYLKNEYNYHFSYQKNKFSINTENKSIFFHRTLFNDHFSFIDFYPFLFETNRLKIKLENEKKLNYLKENINELGFEIKEKNGELFFKKIKKAINSNKEDTPEEEPINKKGLPPFDTLDRYQLVKKLGIDDIIHNLDTSQRSKSKVLALIMNIHPDNARKLFNNTYPKLKSDEEIAKLVFEANHNVNEFLNNPINSIKIP
ncbi:hypothetical protein ACFQ0I_15160 [Mariniflexile aquimaris]|uniref:Uncharacterized protein n=1 Tax=Mariniflexile aquimaris TaxID=881009 RepID=A0ABW3BVX7_9FLAO